MIRKLAVILLFSVAPLHNLNAAPQWANKPIQCASPQEVMDLLKGYGEEPYIYFEGSTTRPSGSFPSTFLITRNSKESTWTLVEMPDSEQACILGAGRGEIKINNDGITT